VKLPRVAGMTAGGPVGRRKLLGGAGSAGFAAFATPALAQGVSELKMVTTWARGTPGLGTAAQRISDRVRALSGGKLTIRVYAAGELVPAAATFDAVLAGTADLYHASEEQWAGKSRALPLFTSFPFGLTHTELEAWILHGGGQDLWDEVSGNLGLKCFLAGNAGAQMFGWFRRDIKALPEIKGQKLRMTGYGADIMRALGATIVDPGPSEFVAALKSGKIDGASWIGPWHDLLLGLHQAARFYFSPGLHAPSRALSVGISRRGYERLTEEQRSIIQHVVLAESTYTTAEFHARNAEALETLVGRENVRLRRVPADIARAMARAATDLQSDLARQDAMAAKVLESMTQFRRRALELASHTTEPLLTARRTLARNDGT
jgi:TRAP-type mannitol/chloroaromatic compound transport system substrate-binding protein